MVFLYIDPGAGSLVIQAILAAVLGIPFVFRTRLVAMLARLRRADSDPDPEHTEDP